MLRLFIIYCIIGLVCCLLANLGFKKDYNLVMTWKYIILCIIIWPFVLLGLVFSKVNKQFAEYVDNLYSNLVNDPNKYNFLEEEDES